MQALRESDVIYLKVLENGPFDPVSFLYGSVYGALEDRGLVIRHQGGYLLTAVAKQLLAAHRATR